MSLGTRSPLAKHERERERALEEGVFVFGLFFFFFLFLFTLLFGIYPHPAIYQRSRITGRKR